VRKLLPCSDRLCSGDKACREQGFSVIEVVMAMSLLMVILAGLGLEMGSALTLTRNNRNRSIAANLASGEMDLVRSSDFTTLPTGRTTSTATVDATTYTIARDSEWVAQNSTTGPCDGSGSTKPALLRVTVAVSWPDMAGTQPVRSQSALTPPVGAYDRYTGNIAVRVRDRDGNPAPSHQVIATTGASTTSQLTTADGCAFFAFLSPGAYQVTVQTPGSVDRQGASVPSSTATVGVGATSSVDFDYDRAASIALTMSGASGGAVPSSMAVTLANGGLLPNEVKSFTGSGSPRTIADLFPFANGYQYWAGSCADADPEAQDPNGGGALYPGATRPDPISVGPGLVFSGSLVLASVDVKVVDSLNNSLAGVAVTAHHDPDTSCASGEDLAAGTTDANGMLRVALPYGTWSLRVAAGSASGSSSVTVSPLSADLLTTTVVVG